MKYLAWNWQYSTLPSSLSMVPLTPWTAQYLHFGCHFRSMLLERFEKVCLKVGIDFNQGSHPWSSADAKAAKASSWWSLWMKVVMPTKKHAASRWFPEIWGRISDHLPLQQKNYLNQMNWNIKTDLKPSLRKDPKLETEPTRALRKEHATEVKTCEIKAAIVPTTTYFWTKQLLCDHTTPLLGGSRKCLDQESIFKLISTLKKPNRENLGKASVLQSHTWRRPLQPAWRGLLVPGPVMATGWS